MFGARASHQLNDVFGVKSEPILSYIERKNVDNKFISCLSQDRHIIIYGASKQGKTALLNKHLKSGQDYIMVNSSPAMGTIDIYRSIVRQLDIKFAEIEIKSQSIGGEAGGKAGISVDIPLLMKFDFGGSGKVTGEETKETQFKRVNYNLELAQDISELLKNISFNKRIVIENFHYLNDETQKKIAFDLRVFLDYGFTFIILGIWRERNRLSQFNGDLLDRVMEVPVEPWIKSEFAQVLDEGSTYLNVDFSEIKDDLIESCHDSIGVLQELSKQCCIASDVHETSSDIIKLTNDHLEVAKIVKLQDYSSRHLRALESFIDQQENSPSEELPLFIPFYFVKVLFSMSDEEIKEGISRNDLFKRINEIHHRESGIRHSDIGYFLNNLIKKQISKSIIPPIVDYDNSTRQVKIIDSTLHYFLINTNREEFFQNINDPTTDLD